jgi:hypothetical protein
VCARKRSHHRRRRYTRIHTRHTSSAHITSRTLVCRRCGRRRRRLRRQHEARLRWVWYDVIVHTALAYTRTNARTSHHMIAAHNAPETAACRQDNSGRAAGTAACGRCVMCIVRHTSRHTRAYRVRVNIVTSFKFVLLSQLKATANRTVGVCECVTLTRSRSHTHTSHAHTTYRQRVDVRRRVEQEHARPVRAARVVRRLPHGSVVDRQLWCVIRCTHSLPPPPPPPPPPNVQMDSAASPPAPAPRER